MAKHDKYDEWFEPATAVMAEGARVGFATCKACGAVVLLDPRDETNRAHQHAEWHIRQRTWGGESYNADDPQAG